ncbi:tripartite tricarboxylate transporter substrate binding protein [Halomonas sp. LBP4]|uniref:tripartite tricarboxylate transporter substrate binding protein n=1 Tax=Halomonas sp. LBP4 TaxID=2044917 RepID=UPI000D76815B|nr:tripartite tricarboxylate transporter substrate binding protein [Halomonas sp. LBP4]PXX95102.1 tricarboxylate transport protein TctC [Halomonas sp. LBP4]
MTTSRNLKRLATAITLSTAALAASTSALADYPERRIDAVVPWGAGGSTDNMARSLTPHVEKRLDTDIVINNRPGGTGVIGTNVVRTRPANGYSLLYGAENAQLYPILELADFDYGDLHPVSIIGQGIVLIVAPADSEWEDFGGLMADAQANPGQLRMGDAGAGGLPSTVLAMINAVDKLDVRSVTFGGDGPAITAMLGNHLDFMPMALASAQEQIRAGKLKALAVLSDEPAEQLPEVPPITEFLPEMADFLPWGPFWGAYVHEDTPHEIKTTLENAYAEAIAQEEFQGFLARNGATSLNLQGDEAESFLSRWQSVTAWAMEDAGSAKVSPERLGIPRP